MVGPSLSIRPAIAIPGFDILVLVLYLHVWLVVAGLAVRNDDAQTGIAWIDQRIHMSNRLYRNTARVPRGLTPRVNRVSYMTHPTVLMNTVVTWIKDRNPKQLPAVARKCDTSQNPATAGATGVVGRGGAADPHGRTERSGVNSSRPILGRSRGIKFACDSTARSGTCGQNGEAAGLAPAVLHSGLLFLATVVVWLPFALGQYPIGSNTPFGRTRTVVVPVGVGSILVGAGFYCLGGLVTNLQSYLTVRRLDPVKAAAVEPGPIQVSGRVVPIDEPVEAPLTGTKAVCYQLSATRTPGAQAADSGQNRTDESGSIDAGTGSQLASVATETSLLDDTRTRFAIEDDTGSVVVDPTNAELRIERTVSTFVPGDQRAPDPLASHLLERSGLSPADRDRYYHEATIEPGAELTVLGVATDETDRSSVSGPTITASDQQREFVVAPGCDQQVDHHYRATIAGCAAGSVSLIASGFWLLWLLAGH